MAKISDIAIVVAILGGAYLLLAQVKDIGKGVSEGLQGLGGGLGGGININLGGTTLPVTIPQAFSYTLPTIGPGFITADAAKFGAEQGVQVRKTLLDIFNIPFNTGLELGQRMIGMQRSQGAPTRMFTPQNPERFRPRRTFNETDTRPGSIAMAAIDKYRVNFGAGR